MLLFPNVFEEGDFQITLVENVDPAASCYWVHIGVYDYIWNLLTGHYPSSIFRLVNIMQVVSYCCTICTLFFFCIGKNMNINLVQQRNAQLRTFQRSSSACTDLYCFNNSSSTFFNPSAFVCNAGSTSCTVRSTNTPLTMRKHLRFAGKGFSVSRTSLNICQYQGYSGTVRGIMQKATGFDEEQSVVEWYGIKIRKSIEDIHTRNEMRIDCSERWGKSGGIMQHQPCHAAQATQKEKEKHSATART